MLIEGWKKRYYHLEDLFINWVAYPLYLVNSDPKHQPRIEDFYRHRQPKESPKELYERIKDTFNL